jgi:hypothetical protein
MAKQKKKKKKEDKCSYVRKRSADLPFLTGRRRRADRVSRAVCSRISLPPSFPYQYLLSFHKHGYDHSKISTDGCDSPNFLNMLCFLPVFLATEIKGSRKIKFTIFSLLTRRDSIGSLTAPTNGNVDEGFQKVTQPIGSTVGLSSVKSWGEMTVTENYPFTSFLCFFYCSDLAFFWGSCPNIYGLKKN